MDKGYRGPAEGQMLWVRGADGPEKPEGLDTGKATSGKGHSTCKDPEAQWGDRKGNGWEGLGEGSQKRRPVLTRGPSFCQQWGPLGLPGREAMLRASLSEDLGH